MTNLLNRKGFVERRMPFHEQLIYRFENDYGASVIFGEILRGGYEIAVIRWVDGNTMSEKEFEIDYSTYITDDVIQGLSEEDVLSILDRIEGLE